MNHVLVALFVPVIMDIRTLFRFLIKRAPLVAYLCLCVGVYIYWAGSYSNYIDLLPGEDVPSHATLWLILSCTYILVCKISWPYVSRYPSRVREEMK